MKPELIQVKIRLEELQIGDIFQTLNHTYYLVELGAKFLVLVESRDSIYTDHPRLAHQSINLKAINYRFYSPSDLEEILISSYLSPDGLRYRQASYIGNNHPACLRVYHQFLSTLPLEGKRDCLLSTILNK
jgi:hypothetical protein